MEKSLRDTQTSGFKCFSSPLWLYFWTRSNQAPQIHVFHATSRDFLCIREIFCVSRKTWFSEILLFDWQLSYEHQQTQVDNSDICEPSRRSRNLLHFRNLPHTFWDFQTLLSSSRRHRATKKLNILLHGWWDSFKHSRTNSSEWRFKSYKKWMSADQPSYRNKRTIQLEGELNTNSSRAEWRMKKMF